MFYVYFVFVFFIKLKFILPRFFSIKTCQACAGLSTLSFSGLRQALGHRGEAARVQPEHRGGGQRHRLFLGGDHHLFIRFEGNYYLLIYFIFLIVIFQTITYIHRALPSPSSWRRQLITIAFFYSFLLISLFWFGS